MRAIIAEYFPELSSYNIGKIDRGISNVKYWLEAEARFYVIKVFTGHDHRRRALVEYGVLSRLHERAVVPVPEPVACIRAESSLPYSYLVMSRVDGTPVDELIQLLGDEEASSLGEAVGVLLNKLHRSDPDVSDAFPLRRVSAPSMARRAETDRQLVLKAEKLGVLTPGEAQRFLELRSVQGSKLTTRVLIHGDLGLENVIVATVHGLQVAALIDLEYCTIDEAAFDFAKLTLGKSRQSRAFAEAVRASYLRAAGATTAEEANFAQEIICCEMVSDLRVAMDLAGSPFHDLHSLVTTEHQAWQQVDRLYRTLREGSHSVAKMASLSIDEIMLRAWELSRTSSCKVRRVGALVIDNAGSVVSSGINELRPAAAVCWCSAAEPGPQRPSCPAIHAERNAILAAFERGISLHGLTMFCSTCPCVECARWIVRAGLSAVFYVENYLDAKGLDYLLASGVATRKMGLADGLFAVQERVHRPDCAVEMIGGKLSTRRIHPPQDEQRAKRHKSLPLKCSSSTSQHPACRPSRR
jgi:dCMP deaminase